MGESARRCSPRKRTWKQHGAERHSGSPTGCRTSATLRRRPRRHPLVLGRRHQPLGRRLPDEHRLDPRRPAVARELGQLRPRHREPEPAGVRRHAGQQRRRWSTARATGARASCPPSTRASASRAGAEPIPNLNTPEGVTDAEQRGKLDFLDRLNRAVRRAAPRADRARGADRQLRAGLPHAGRSARGRRPVAGDRGDPGRSTASTRRRPPPFGRLCLLARRLVERGVRFVQLYHGAGSKWDAHAEHREEPRRALPRDGQARRRPAQGPQSARPARRDAGRLGRRVRPHADVARRATAATTTRPASPCGWPAAA